LNPPASPFCLWEEYQRTGAYRDMLRWLKHRAYCYAVVQPEGYPELFLSVAATPEQIDHETGWIELRRAPGSCCPEPSCDYASHDGSHCDMCGHACADCRRKG
jgi:hypothetical protein